MSQQVSVLNRLLLVTYFPGLVTLLRSLREHEERFITIQAIDHGTPPLSAISTLKLSAIPRMAKEAPQFAQQNYR